MTLSKKSCDCKCEYKPRKILTSKQAEKQPIGSFYHPSEKTVRSGACPIGSELRKGYKRKSYVKGTKKIKSTYVEPVCVKDKGQSGKLLPEYKPITLNKSHVLGKYGYSTKLDKTDRHKTLLKASKDLTYKSVISRLVALRTLTKKSDVGHSQLYNTNIKELQKWRLKNPDLYKKKSESLKKNRNNVDTKLIKNQKSKSSKKPVKFMELFKKTDKKSKSKSSKKPVKFMELFKKTDKKSKSPKKPVKFIELFKKTDKKSKSPKKPVKFIELFKKTDKKSNSKSPKKPSKIINMLKKIGQK